MKEQLKPYYVFTLYLQPSLEALLLVANYVIELLIGLKDSRFLDILGCISMEKEIAEWNRNEKEIWWEVNQLE